ncbi:ATP-binding protein [Methylovirgula sp. 4M-Z18]|uniref:ATP-binding protein n=1 Tax=Methylovirgula sp. 4M-Z18 TaxID=2293567 RepID=UPI000E2EEE75|nr:ATP-binding protein [Methylovirgula sp. 4M-Z18]RFB79329.1 GHKL domain-containing protein [Methylovirgula sp. 4M-Z18]
MDLRGWSALIEALPEPVLVLSPDMRVLTLNQPALRLLPALRRGEALELALRSPDILDAFRRVRASGVAETVSWHERVPIERLFHVRVAKVSDEAIVLSIRDLTEARSLERMRVDFIANASHELRTPLASLLGFVETLRGAARDDARVRDKFLGIMYQQARRMARLIDDLLSLSRVEQNLHQRPTDVVDLNLVVRHIAEALSPLAAENLVKLNLPSSEPVLVAGDRDELSRVAENLIENAIKYSSNGETEVNVDITVTTTATDAVLKVHDDGPGIAPEHLPRLTERFYRVDTNASRSKGGTGLGLALVKHIAARHRGRLFIESELGRGATFTIKLPLRK